MTFDQLPGTAETYLPEFMMQDARDRGLVGLLAESELESSIIEVSGSRDVDAVARVWVILSEPGVDILLGAAGSAVWAGFVKLCGRASSKTDTSIRVEVRGRRGTVLIETSGSAAVVESTLQSAPRVLRAALDEKTTED